MSKQTLNALLFTAIHTTAGKAATRSLLLISLIALSACVTSGTNPYPTGDSSLAGRIKSCRAGDTQISSSENCLQDDAACYQLAGGDWCTGPRGTQCPAGSTELPANANCPAGARCFQLSESKHCQISFK